MSIPTRRELIKAIWYDVDFALAGVDESSFPTTVQLSLTSQALFARYDPSGRFIAAGCYMGPVHIWDLTTKTITMTLTGHKKQVTSVESVRSFRWLL